MPELPERIRRFYAEAALSAEVAEDLIAAGRKARRQRIAAWGALATAAVLALLIWVGPAESRAKLTVESIDEQVSEFFRRPDARLDFASADPRDVRAWLEARQGPGDFKIPPGLVGNATVGCEILGSGDRRIFVICFIDPARRIGLADTSGVQRPPAVVHLVLTPKKAFAVVPPPMARARFATHQGWAFAAWTEGEHVYLLTTDAGVEPLKRALGA